MTDDSRIIYIRFAAGLCPCCGGPLGNQHDTPDVGIGEGVMMCGWCVERRHNAPDIVLTILRDLIVR